MMQKILISLVLLLSACGPVIVSIDGQPYVVEMYPLNGVGSTPTPEVNSTPFVPTSTPTTICVLTAPQTGWVNVRNKPLVQSTVVGQFRSGQLTSEAYWRQSDVSVVWYRVIWEDQVAWIAGVSSLSVFGCDRLEFISPF